MEPYRDRPEKSEMFIIRSAENNEGWTWKFITESRMIVMEYWYDLNQTLKRIRVRDAGCGKHWPDQAKEELDKMVLEGRIRVEKCEYYQS